MARTRAAELARETTGRELLGAALEVFVDKGYHTTTISDIVHAAGVTQGTFYLYYKNKADIFSALLKEYRESMISGLFGMDLEQVRTAEDWILMADRISDFLLDHMKTHGDFLRLFLTEAKTIGSAFHEEGDAFSETITEEIARLLRHGNNLGLIRNVDIEAVALSVFGALKEAVGQSCFENGRCRPEDIIPRVIRSQTSLLMK